MTTTRRTLILAVLLVAAGSLIFTTGAAVIDGEADTLADDHVAIQPAAGPNGDYAYLNDDDEIVVDVSPTNPNLSADFEGVNVGSTGRIGDVFTITYTANETADVWIEHEGENVTFVTDDGPVETESNAVTLGPNGSVSVGLQFDTRGAEPNTRLGAEEFAIHANVTDPGSDSGPSSTPGQQSAGAADEAPEPTPSVTVGRPSPSERSLEATGLGSDDTVGFEMDRVRLNETNVTLDYVELRGVSTETVSMETTGSPVAFADGGELDAAQEPVPMGYLSVTHEFDPTSVGQMRLRFSVDRAHLGAVDPADLVVFRQTDAGGWEPRETTPLDAATVDRRGLSTDRVHLVATTDDFSTFALATHVDRIGVREATVADATVEAGAETTVTATAENAGGAAGERTLTLTADGAAVDTVDVALEPGESTTVTFSAAFETTGTYDLAVEGTPVGELSVGTTASTETTPVAEGATDPDDGGSASDSGEGSSPAPPTDEPGGFGLADLGRLAALLAAVVAVLALARRRRRS